MTRGSESVGRSLRAGIIGTSLGMLWHCDVFLGSGDY